MAGRGRRRRARAHRLQPHPRDGRGGGGRLGASRSPTPPARRRPPRRRGDGFAGRRRRVPDDVQRRRRPRRRPRLGHGGRDTSTVAPETVRGLEPEVRAAGAPPGRHPGLRQRVERRGRQASCDGRRRRRTTSSGPGRCWTLRRADHPPRPARGGRDHEARGQRDGVRAQPDPRRGAGARREGRASPATAYEVIAAGAVAAPFVHYKRAAYRGSRVARRSRSRSTWWPRTSTSLLALAERVGAPVAQLGPTAPWWATRSRRPG